MTGFRQLTRSARQLAQHKRLGSGAFAAALAFVLPLAVVPATSATAQKVTGNGVGSQFELLYWQSVASSEDSSQFQAYLTQYPDGTFAALARAKIATLARQAEPASGPPPAPALPAAAAVTPAPVAMAPRPAAPAMPEAPAPEPVQPPPPHLASSADATTVAINTAPSPFPALPTAAPAPATPSTPVDPVAIIMGTAPAPTLSPAPAAPTVALPPRPQFAPTPPVNLPGRFCSATERNDFYDAVYRPSKDVADQNNQTAIAHMRKLQALYDALGRQSDTNAQNMVSAEARNWQGVAASAYQSSVGYDALFNRLMAVPIAACPGTVTP